MVIHYFFFLLGAVHGPDGNEALSALRYEHQPVLPAAAAAGGAVPWPALRLPFSPQIPDGDAWQRADGDGRDAVPSTTGRRRSVQKEKLQKRPNSYLCGTAYIS